MRHSNLNDFLIKFVNIYLTNIVKFCSVDSIINFFHDYHN